MRVYGLDFTSAPGRGKPLVVARCRLRGDTLALEGFEIFEQSGPLAALLGSPGPWVMGCDFPFSHPARLLAEAGEHLAARGLPARWPMDWEDYLRGVAGLSREDFIALMKSCPPDARGVRERRRITGEAAGASSPMHVDFPPVGLMFHAASRLLLECPCDVVPQRMRGGSRRLFEVYPGAFAERFCGSKSYKEGPPGQRALRRTRREAMLAAMRGERFRETYGVGVSFGTRNFELMASDKKGDFLDALVCAAQAAWAARTLDSGGPPPWPQALSPEILAFEGWIMDPHCAGDAPPRPKAS